MYRAVFANLYAISLSTLSFAIYASFLLLFSTTRRQVTGTSKMSLELLLDRSFNEYGILESALHSLAVSRFEVPSSITFTMEIFDTGANPPTLSCLRCKT
jgi:hypothetical protein